MVSWAYFVSELREAFGDRLRFPRTGRIAVERLPEEDDGTHQPQASGTAVIGCERG